MVIFLNRSLNKLYYSLFFNNTFTIQLMSQKPNFQKRKSQLQQIFKAEQPKEQINLQLLESCQYITKRQLQPGSQFYQENSKKKLHFQEGFNKKQQSLCNQYQQKQQLAQKYKGKEFLKHNKNTIIQKKQTDIPFRQQSKSLKSNLLFSSSPFVFPPPPQQNYFRSKKSVDSQLQYQTKFSNQYQNVQKRWLQNSKNENTFQSTEEVQSGVLYIQNVHSKMLKKQYFQLALNEYGNIIQIKIDQNNNQAEVIFQKRQSVEAILKKKLILFNRTYIRLSRKRKALIFQQLINKRLEQQNQQQKQRQQSLKRFSTHTQLQLKKQIKRITSQQLRLLYYVQKLLQENQQMIKQVKADITQIQILQESLKNQNYFVGEEQAKIKNQNPFDWKILFSYTTDFQVGDIDIKRCFHKIGPITQSSVESHLQKKRKYSQIQLEYNQEHQDKSRFYLQNQLKQNILINRSNQYKQNLISSLNCQSLPIHKMFQHHQNQLKGSLSVPSQKYQENIPIEDLFQNSNQSIKSQINNSNHLINQLFKDFEEYKKQEENEDEETNISYSFRNNASIKFTCPKYAYLLYQWFKIPSLGFKNFSFQVKGEKVKKYFQFARLQKIQKRQKQHNEQKLSLKVNLKSQKDFQNHSKRYQNNSESNQAQSSQNILFKVSQNIPITNFQCQNQISDKENKIQSIAYQNETQIQQAKVDYESHQNIDILNPHNQKQQKLKMQKRSYSFLEEEDETYKQINSIIEFWDQNISQNQTQNGNLGNELLENRYSGNELPNKHSGNKPLGNDPLSNDTPPENELSGNEKSENRHLNKETSKNGHSTTSDYDKEHIQNTLLSQLSQTKNKLKQNKFLESKHLRIQQQKNQTLKLFQGNKSQYRNKQIKQCKEQKRKYDKYDQFNRTVQAKDQYDKIEKNELLRQKTRYQPYQQINSNLSNKTKFDKSYQEGQKIFYKENQKKKSCYKDCQDKYYQNKNYYYKRKKEFDRTENKQFNLNNHRNQSQNKKYKLKTQQQFQY